MVKAGLLLGSRRQTSRKHAPRMTARNRPKGPEGIARRTGRAPVRGQAMPLLVVLLSPVMHGPAASCFVTHAMALTAGISALVGAKL